MDQRADDADCLLNGILPPPLPPISVNKYLVFNRLEGEPRRKYMQIKGVICRYLIVNGLRAVLKKSPGKQRARRLLVPGRPHVLRRDSRS